MHFFFGRKRKTVYAFNMLIINPLNDAVTQQ